MLLKHLELLQNLSEKAQKIREELYGDKEIIDANDLYNSCYAQIRGLDKDSLIFVFKHAPTDGKKNVPPHLFGLYHARDLIPAKLENDPEVLQAALKSDPLALYGAGEELRGNVEFMKWADDFTGGYAFQYALGEALESQELFDTHIMNEITNNDVKNPLESFYFRPSHGEYNSYLKQKLNDPEFVNKVKDLIKSNPNAPKEKLENFLKTVECAKASSMGE